VAEDQTTPQNPQTQGAQPPFPDPSAAAQTPPGDEGAMDPRPDYGETTYRGSERLTGKAAFITGADSGIGRAVALAFAREGADILLGYLPEEESDARETVRVVEAAGRKAVTFPGDIADEAYCQRAVERAVDEFGHLDILVNNAAFQRTHESIDAVPSDEFERTFRVNVFGMFYLCKAAVARMGVGATIINTASIEASNPDASLLAYATTKGAIVTFTKALAKEVVEKGIRVNAVAPGPVWTPLIPSTMPLEQAKSFGQETPMKRPGQPAELASAFVFLASQESSYITGEVIGVTGGLPLP